MSMKKMNEIKTVISRNEVIELEQAGGVFCDTYHGAEIVLVGCGQVNEELDIKLRAITEKDDGDSMALGLVFRDDMSVEVYDVGSDVEQIIQKVYEKTVERKVRK